LLPTLWVCALTFLLSDEQSLYSSQVESRSRSPAHQGDYVRDVLTGLKVEQFLTPQQPVPVLYPGDRLETVIERLGNSPYLALPVIDDDGRFLGVVSLEQVHLASRLPDLRAIVVAADMMRTDVVPLRPGDRIDDALELFVENDLLELPVVGNGPERRLLGIVKRAQVSSTYLHHVHGMKEGTDGAEHA
jgi:CIC family chloride channel protein